MKPTVRCSSAATSPGVSPKTKMRRSKALSSVRPVPSSCNSSAARSSRSSTRVWSSERLARSSAPREHAVDGEESCAAGNRDNHQKRA